MIFEIIFNWYDEELMTWSSNETIGYASTMEKAVNAITEHLGDSITYTEIGDIRSLIRSEDEVYTVYDVELDKFDF